MLFSEEKAYLDLLSNIIENGSISANERTGTGTRSLFGQTMSFDLTDGKIPIISTRKMPLKFLPIELVWFIKGDTDIRYLKERGVSIWDSWVIPETKVYDRDPSNALKDLEKQGKIKLDDKYKDVFKFIDPFLFNKAMGIVTGIEIPESRLIAGSIGKSAYGSQWRKWEDIRKIDEYELQSHLDKGYQKLTSFNENETVYIDNVLVDKDNNRYTDGKKEITDVKTKYIVTKHYDQLQEAIDLIKNDPDSRRIIVTAWNPGRRDQQALPPCHMTFQFYVEHDNQGDKHLSCALYQRSADAPVGLVANWAQYAMLTHLIAQVTGCKAKRLVWFGANVHVYENQVELVQAQLQRMPRKNTIKLKLNDKCKNIDDFKPEDIQITGYENYNEPIKYLVAV